MSASRFFGIFGASIFRSHRQSLHLAAPLLPIRFASPILHFHRRCSSACDHAFPVSSENPVNVRNHPWPEWVSFFDFLKAKGYLTESVAASSAGDIVFLNEGNGDEFAYMDMNLMKNACLSFGRDRFDILKMLSTQDMQAVVEKGCPNLFRKAVNSAKRLRVYLKLDEGHACGACNLRGSCDRAYVILNKTEEVARTVDIVRLLLFYAMNPLVISGGEKPPGREIIEDSVRKLLSELIELSEKPIDPELKKPTPKASLEKKHSDRPVVDEGLERKGHLMGRETKTRKKVRKGDVEMKLGDWICSQCNCMNFAKNTQCFKCKAEAPDNNIEMKKGDWKCIRCNFMNFAKNMQCKRCKAEAQERSAGDDIEMKEGDWKCIKCKFVNFANRSSCKICTEPRPKRQLNPGEWECPSCNFLNFRRNVCKKCDHERPRQLLTEKQYGEDFWRKL